MVTVLPESTIEDAVDLPALLPVVGDALIQQWRGAVERPDRPHFPVGQGIDGNVPLGTGLTMPAYIHGDPYFVTKLASVHEDNPARGLPTVHAQILLTDARTGVPEALLGGRTVTNARTGCIGGLAVQALAPAATTVGVIGAGAQARWQTRAIDAVAELDTVRVFSPSESRERCATDLRKRSVPATAVDSPTAAVAGADVVVTATTSTEPVFPASALAEGALVVAVGAYTGEMQELEPAVLREAAHVFADVPEEAAETGDLLAAGYSVTEVVPMGKLLAGGNGGEYAGSDRETNGPRTGCEPGTTVVKSVGSAVLDAAASQFVYDRAGDTGTAVPLDG